MKGLPLFKTLALTAGFALITVPPVHGQIKLVIEGNGEGSQNSASLNVSETTTVEQSNTADVTNNADAGANTGGNSGGNVTTGDASAGVSIENTFNNNSAYVDPCCQDGKVPTPTPDGNGHIPTPTPTLPGGNGVGGNGVGGNGGNGDGDGGGNGGNGDGVGGEAVLGLADTSGGLSVRLFLSTVGFLLSSAGVALYTKRQ